MQYTEEQIIRANQTDLVSFLNAQGEQLVKSGREYRWKKHDSVTVSGNRWYRHSQSKGGYPVDFVMEFYYATFPEAVKMLIGEEGEGRQKSCPAPSKDFRLPEKNEDNEMIVKYLTESRELEKNLVMEWIVRGDIYEEKNTCSLRADRRCGSWHPLPERWPPEYPGRTGTRSSPPMPWGRSGSRRPKRA